MNRMSTLISLVIVVLLGVSTALAHDVPGMHGGPSDNVYPCIAAPLPIEPIGDRQTSHFEDAGQGFTLHAWRFACDGDRSVPMLTVSPDDGDTPYLCPDDGVMVQNMHQDDRYRLVQDPQDPTHSFCGRVIVPTTLALVGLEGHPMNVDQAFMYALGSGLNFQMPWSDYDASRYGVDSAGHAILLHRGLTGIWYDPVTSGQGFSLHMTPRGLVAFFFGYDSTGSRLWLISSAEEQPVAYDDSLSMTLYQGSGGAFDRPSPDVDMWGSATVAFHDCEHASITIDGQDGQTSLDLVKLAGTDGVRCY